MTRRRTVGICVLTLAMGGAAAVASADEGGSATEAQAPPAVTVSAPASLAAVFQGAGRRAGAAKAATTDDHIFGVGIRLNSNRFGVGGTVRYFPSGPLGFQAEVVRYSLGAGLLTSTYDYGSTQFNGEVLYRFNEIKLEAPLRLQPYAGGGISFIRTSFLDVSNNSAGVVVTGGVEVFFEQVPKLGVSGAIEFTSNGDINNVAIGGGTFLVAAHWYLK